MDRLKRAVAGINWKVELFTFVVYLIVLLHLELLVGLSFWPAWLLAMFTMFVIGSAHIRARSGLPPN